MTTIQDQFRSFDAQQTEVEQRVLADWRMRPQKAIAYYGIATPAEAEAGVRSGVHTFLGTRLGTIIRSRVFRHNFGARFIAIRVRATNGAEYYGRASYDWGNAVILHRAKR